MIKGRGIRDEITVDYVLRKFKEILDDDSVKWETKVKALELLGKYLNMFVDQKKVNIDIRSLVTGASLDDLCALAGEVKGEESRKLGSVGSQHPIDLRDDDGRGVYTS